MQEIAIHTRIQADRIADALAADGWCHMPALLGIGLVTALRADLLARRAEFVPAAVGRAHSRQQVPQQRSDSTLWLNAEGDAQREFLQLLDAVRQTLNRQLFLGLADTEAHYAHYAPGEFYRRHVDAFRDAAPGLPQRVVSAVFYLNEDWRAECGGELLLWYGQGEPARIAPLADSAVFFLSAECPHEVLPASADRYSIAAWLRTRGGV